MTSIRDVRLELGLPDWTDVTTPDLLADDSIDVTRGRQDEGAHTDPSSATVALRTTTGKFAPRNPTGIYYGQLGRNTPARLSTGRRNWRAASTVDLVDKTAQLAPSVDSPWSAARLFCAWAGPAPAATYTYPGGMTGTAAWTDAKSAMGSAHEAITSAGATGTRTGTMSVAEDYLSASVLLSGTVTVKETETDVDSILTTDSGTVAGDWLLIFTYWAWDDEDEVIPHTPIMDEGGWIPVVDTGTVNVADADAAYFRMRGWLKRVKTPGAHNIFIPGPATNLSIMRVVSGVTNWWPRITGEASSWPQSGIRGGQFAQTTTTIAGVTQRLGQGSPALRSALARRVPTKTPPRIQYATGQGVVAYWPMEDAAQSRGFASGLPGGSPMLGNAPTLVDPASQEGPPGSLDLPTWKQNGSMFGKVPTIVTYGRNPTITKSLTVPWRVDWVFYMGTSPGGTARELISVFTSSDNLARWYLLCTATGLSVACDDDSGALVFSDAFGSIPADFYGKWHRCKLRINQSGSTVSYIASIVSMDGTVDASWSANVAGSHSAGRPSSVGLLITSTDERSIGHVTVTQDAAISMDPFGLAYNGFTGETAADRVERLCHEEDLDCEIVGDDASCAAGVSPRSAAMGPQRPVSLLELLQECADADQGILYEPRGMTGVAYRTLGSLYNRPAIFTLPYGTGVYAEPPNTVDDDQSTRNDITATRSGGSSYRAVLEEGPLSIQSHPDGVGRYDDSIDVNVEADSDLGNVAGWALHLGTVDAARFPTITVHPGLRVSDLAFDLDIGDRITLTNLPIWASSDPVDLIVQGSTDQITKTGHDLVINCTPESPYHVVMWESAVSGTAWKWDTAGSALAAGITSTATSLSVATTVGPVWTAADAEDGFDIYIGGERMTVTDIAGTTSPQTFTVIRSVNGIVKAQSTGADVRLWKTPVWAR